jgi:hypothetical protein
MKYVIKITLILGICLAGSCQPKPAQKMPKPPMDLGKNIISKEKLNAVLEDLFLVEAYKSVILFRTIDTLRQERLKGYYQDVFKKNGVSDTDFFYTFKYYQLQKHQELEKIFGNINEKFQTRKKPK